MATAFSSLYGFIKVLVGDGDNECSLYGSDLLNSQIRTAILFLNDSAILEDGTTADFTNDLTNLQILRVVLQSAINILNPLPELFHHRSPILEVTRRRGREYVESLKDKLDEVSGDRFPIAADTEFQAIMNSVSRWIADFDHALVNP